jgi:phenylpropionate dioxygenase-like ring-hydroxylating dioxygenase large terminal subunit
MFLTNFWYIAALKGEVNQKPMRRTILGTPVVLYRTPDNEVAALEDRCIHREVPLSKGEVLADGGLRCIYHGMVFDRAGICRHIPEQTRIPNGARVRAFPLVEKYEWAWIWMGDPELADPASIPNCSWFDMAGWKARTGRLEVKSNHRLIIDNLLNMAHLPYVHPRTIGTEGVFNAKVSVKREGQGVRLLRMMHNIEPPPTYKKAGGFEGNVNRWQDIRFKAPNLFEFNTGVIDADHPIPEPDTHVSPRPGLHVLSRHTMHAVCPQTQSTTHYYFGFSYNPEEMAEDVANFVFESAYKTFVEDVEILEAQQINIESMPNRPKLDIVSDAAGIQAMRILDELERHASLAGKPIARTA